MFGGVQSGVLEFQLTDSTYSLPLLPFTPLTAAGLTGYGPPLLGLEIETPNHGDHNLLAWQL